MTIVSQGYSDEEFIQFNIKWALKTRLKRITAFNDSHFLLLYTIADVGSIKVDLSEKSGL